MKSNKFLSIFFIAYLLCFFTFHMVLADKNFSEIENRPLQEAPTFSTENLFDGSFTKQFETYIADQFPIRDEFISLKSYSELITGKKDSNGVFIGKDGYFMQKWDKPDMALTEKNIGYINEFAKKYSVNFMLAPTATETLKDKLPTFATPYSENTYKNDLKASLENINFIDPFVTLAEHKNEDIYYKTDHHWTTLGAYYGYVELAKSMNFEPISIEGFNRTPVATDFYGSLFSKGNFKFASPDTIEIFYPKIENKLSVNYIATNRKTDSLYELSNLEKKEKYTVFCDNNPPMIEIKTGIENGKKLLVLKDSYANCFIPFLTNHYEEIYVLDLRFLNMSVSNYLDQKECKDVLFLYNTQNFSETTSFTWLK